jgi:hypothetical protein
LLPGVKIGRHAAWTGAEQTTHSTTIGDASPPAATTRLIAIVRRRGVLV